MSLLQIYQWVCQWKNFENRLTFGEVMGKSLVSCFFETQCFPKIRLFKVRHPTDSHVHCKSGIVKEKWCEIDMCYCTPNVNRFSKFFHWQTHWKYHMAYLFMPFPMTLDDLEGHSPNGGLIKCNSTNICATFTTVLTDMACRMVPRDSWASCCCSIGCYVACLTLTFSCCMT